MDKSEFEKMPDGMSDGELDSILTGEEKEAPENIAQAALDATEESPPAEESVEVKDEPKVEEKAVEEKVAVEEKAEEEELSETDRQLMAKDAKIGEFRRKNRELEIERARLEGEVSARKSIQTAEVKVKSPLEIAEAAYIEEHDNLVGFAMDGELYRKQRAFDDQQAATKTAATQEEQAITKMNREVASLQVGDLAPSKVGDGLDFKSVLALGKGYLRPSDLLKIEETSHEQGIPAGVRKTYELCKEAILAANNEDTILLQNAMKSKTPTKPKKKTEKTDVDTLITGGGDTNTGEVEEDVPHNTKLTNFVCG